MTYDTEIAAKMAEALGDDTLASVIGQLGILFEQMDWAEDEIEQARQLRPQDSDALFHSFRLLTPTHKNMHTEFVYRSHCRELLDRVSHRSDTRPATWAEIVCACSETSQVAPMTEAGFGTYARAWNQAGFPVPFPDLPGILQHVEALHHDGIDELTDLMRRKLTARERTLAGEECSGMHAGEPAPACRYRREQSKAPEAA